MVPRDGYFPKWLSFDQIRSDNGVRAAFSSPLLVASINTRHSLSFYHIQPFYNFLSSSDNRHTL